MQHKRILSAMLKAGATIKEDGSHFKAIKGNTVVEWCINGGMQMMQNGDGHVVGVCKRSPHTNAMYDNFDDQYCHSIKSAVAALNSPPIA